MKYQKSAKCTMEDVLHVTRNYLHYKLNRVFKQERS